MSAAFGARLRQALDTRWPLCVGIDPHPGLLGAWGLDDDLAGLERFTRGTVDALAGDVAALKPQSAFFERHGSRGIAVLERCLADSRAAGALVVLDAKRGDIGSTMQAYARAYADPAGPLYADALTVSPYLGPGALQPLVEAARTGSSGIFMLALTSNPEGAALQRAVDGSGRTVAAVVVDAAAQANRDQRPLGPVGLVIGATVPALPDDVIAGLAQLNGAVLAPGLGAQGAVPADLARLFGRAAPVVLPAVLPTYSRDVLQAGPSAAGLRAAAQRYAEQCRLALS